jgi:phosphoglycolate phosphatase
MFDFDGTLADTMRDLVDALVDTLRDQLGNEQRPHRDLVMQMVYMQQRDAIRAVVDMTGWPPSRLQSTLMTVTAGLPTRLFPEVPAVLASLKQSGYVVVISSNNPDSIFRGRLEGVGLTDACDFALGTDIEKGITKEDHPRVAAERLGVLPEELAATGVFVGDLPADMQLARKAGLFAIGRLTGANADSLIAAGAQQVITNLTELEPLLNSLNAATPIDIDDHAV